MGKTVDSLTDEIYEQQSHLNRDEIFATRLQRD
jgi:hypothetical protein